MKKTNKTTIIWLAGVLVGTLAFGQDSGDRVTVPFRDNSRPRTLVVSMIQGSITVRGYNGNDAIVEGSGGSSRRHSTPPPGMHRIDPSSSGLDISGVPFGRRVCNCRESDFVSAFFGHGPGSRLYTRPCDR